MKRHINYMLSVAGTVALAIALGSALPKAAEAQQQYPHGGALDARQHGYEHGYRDGFGRGRDSRDRNGSPDFHSQDYDRGDRGFENGFGDRAAFVDGYHDGYRAGYTDGYNGNTGRFDQIYGYRGSDYNSDRDRGRDHDDNIYQQRQFGVRDVASDIGYRDGLSAGSKDATTGHSFRPHEHESWKDANHGYAGAYGDRNNYKREYRSAYEAGYRDGYGGRR